MFFSSWTLLGYNVARVLPGRFSIAILRARERDFDGACPLGTIKAPVIHEDPVHARRRGCPRHRCPLVSERAPRVQFAAIVWNRWSRIHFRIRSTIRAI